MHGKAYRTHRTFISSTTHSGQSANANTRCQRPVDAICALSITTAVCVGKLAAELAAK
jgi:hypothetical protein